MGVDKRHPATLCWSCQNTDRHKCTWFDPDNQQPIPGWIAEQTHVNGVGESYHVVACPNFLPLDGDSPPAAETLRRATGVRYDRGGGRWVAQIQYRGKYYYLGSYKEQEDAIAARLAAEEAIERGEEPRRNIRRYTT